MSNQRAILTAAIATALVGIGASFAPTVLLLVLTIIWTMFVLQVLGYRATLHPTVLAIYLALGVLLQLVVLPAPAKLAAPFLTTSTLFGEHRALAALLITSELVLLLLSVLLVFYKTRSHLMMSVADVFWLAFVTGLGAELPSALGLTTASWTRFPFLWSGTFAFAGGLIALMWLVALRATRKARLAAALAGVLTLLFASWLMRAMPTFAAESGVNQTSQAWTFIPTTTNGVVWAALIALAVFTWLEGHWAARAFGSLNSRVGVPRRLSAILGFTAREDRAHQVHQQIVKAQLARSPEDQRLQQTEKQMRFESTPRSSKSLALAVASLVVIVVLVALVATVAPTRTPSIWSFLTLAPGVSFPSFANLVLIAILIWLYLPLLGGHATVDGSANQRLAREGAKLIMQLSIGCVVLVLTNVNMLDFVGLSGPAQSWQRLNITQTQLATLLLLFATAASWLARRAAPLTSSMNLTKTITRSASKLAQTLAVVWLSVFLGKKILPEVQSAAGLGDYGAALSTAAISAGLSFVSALLLRVLIDFIKNMLPARAKSLETARAG